MKVLGRLSATTPGLVDLSLLVLRLVAGGFLAYGHGLAKLRGFSEMSAGFPDPLHLGSKQSLMGAIAGELVCGALVAVGLATRLACVGAIFTLAVAAWLVHGGLLSFAPAKNANEPAVVYLMMFVCILLAGPGRYSLDRALGGRRVAVVSAKPAR